MGALGEGWGAEEKDGGYEERGAGQVSSHGSISLEE